MSKNFQACKLTDLVAGAMGMMFAVTICVLWIRQEPVPAPLLAAVTGCWAWAARGVLPSVNIGQNNPPSGS